MSQIVQNVKTILARPNLALPFLKYFILDNVLGLKPTRRFAGNIKIRCFANFSEYHSCSRAIADKELRFLNQFAFGTGAMLDVGANLGIYTMILSHRNPESRIYSFEPHPGLFDALSENIRLNGASNVRAHNLAVGKKDGTAEFLASSLSRATSRMTEQKDANAIRVKVISLDTWIKSNQIEQIAFMKVDVEGFEALVFEGGLEALADGKIKVVFFEVCPDAASAAGFKPADAASILVGCGYGLHRITNNGYLVPVFVEEAKHEVLTNWVALAPGHSDARVLDES